LCFADQMGMVRTVSAFRAGPPTTLPGLDDVQRVLGSSARAVAVARGRRHLTDLGRDLDALARLAARVTGARIGLVNLIGPGEQEHLGRSDPALPERSALPDEQMHCANVVAAGGPLVVLDSRSVPRFADHPAVRDGVMRFYVGAPVLDADGQVLGTVCALDPEPRAEVGDGELSALADIARAASTLLQASLRQAEQAAQRRVLAALAAGESTSAVLEMLAAEVEDLVAADVMCSVLLIDPDTGLLRDAAGPSLPVDYRAAIDGLPPGDGNGSCGAAVFRREAVDAHDLGDPVWASVREVTARYGIEACASLPVLGTSGEVLGTFALYRRRPGSPSAYEWEVLRDFSDLTRVVIEHSRARATLTRLATQDPVTGLSNRAAFLADAAARLTRGPLPGTEHVLLMCDVDQFKLVNASLGHGTGDRYLRTAGAALRDRLRPDDLVSRFTGNAFTVLAADVPTQNVADLADRVRSAFAVPVRLSGHELRLSASVGAARSGISGDALDGLLVDADLAMRAAKAAGRDRARVCDGELRDLDRSRTDLVLALRHAVSAGETHVVYQPEFDVRTGRLVGLEALCRWERPGVGPVSPAEFIPLAEQAGLVGDLGAQVLATVTGQLAAWRHGCPAARDLTAWVNVSAHQLNDAALPGVIADLLRRHDLPGACLGLEVTESAVRTDAETTLAALEQLRRLGVRIAIDDFGTGYSSLSALKALPVDALKIDRSFVSGLPDDSSDRQIVTAVLAMAQALSLSVVAEGVETTEQLHALEQLGCGTAQGFLLGRPQPAASIEALLRDPTYALTSG
jgi:diguanylate cyclase (GGDEF)-like protein